MKELTIEEKAKAYDEAKARMNKAYNDNRCTIGFMNEIFPELKESEDEKIRKTLIDYFNTCAGDYYGELKRSSILAWLEKQGECHISHDDEIMIEQLTEYFTTGRGFQKLYEKRISYENRSI